MAILRRLLPPYHRNLVFALCGVHILFCAIVLAIHQTFWLLSTQIFPTAYRMFDDTHDREPDFPWNKTARQQLDRYQFTLAISWAMACVSLSISMLCIIPQFCTVEVAEDKEVNLCIRRPVIPKLMAPILALSNLLLATCLLTEWINFMADDHLFHILFKDAIKQEAYVTEFEDHLDCFSDEDKEGFDVWKCDRIIERAMLNPGWLSPLLIAQLALAIFSLIACLIFNDQDKISREICSNSGDEEMEG